MKNQTKNPKPLRGTAAQGKEKITLENHKLIYSLRKAISELIHVLDSLYQQTTTIKGESHE